MTPKTVQRLDQLFATMPVLVGGPAEKDEIDVAEQHLGMKFDQDYREFLLRYGGAVVGSLPLLGLRQAEVMGTDTYSVIDVTTRFRADGWQPTEQWVIISVDLEGNPIGLASDGSVWIANHDAGETKMIAATFEHFVIHQLDEYQPNQSMSS